MAKKSNNLAIAVDIGGTNLRTAIVDEKGKIIAKTVTKTIQKGKNGQVVAEQVILEIKKLILRAELLERVKGIGVSFAGPIDYKRGSGVNPPNMNFSYVPLVGPLKKLFKLPIMMINDCNAGALGEKYFGSGKKFSNLVYVTISSGIGGGAIINGNLLLGKGGNASEVGHMTVETQYNLLCTCKKGRGHWEAYASGNNMPKFFKIWAKKNNLEAELLSEAKDIFEAAERKDGIALKFMDELGKINGRGFSNVIAAYDPELIVLSGALALNNGNLMLKYAKNNIDNFLGTPEIKISSLGENAPFLGAAASIFSL
ncbi:MAG: ROK family protein [Parcubacteria group bacterium]